MEQIEFDKKIDENLDLIKAQNPDLLDEELKFLLYMSKKYQLDILTKEIYALKYEVGGKWIPAIIFASRAGFLSIAHRSKQFDGMTSDTGKDMDGLFAICEVYRKDMKHPFYVKVWLNEYIKEKNDFWKNKPKTMLKKVAEAQALKKAFDVNDLYDESERDPRGVINNGTSDLPDNDIVFKLKKVGFTETGIKWILNQELEASQLDFVIYFYENWKLNPKDLIEKYVKEFGWDKSTIEDKLKKAAGELKAKLAESKKVKQNLDKLKSLVNDETIEVYFKNNEEIEIFLNVHEKLKGESITPGVILEQYVVKVGWDLDKIIELHETGEVK